MGVESSDILTFYKGVCDIVVIDANNIPVNYSYMHGLNIHSYDIDSFIGRVHRLPSKVRLRLVHEYSMVVIETMENTELAHRKSNAARANANERLRLYCDKYMAAYNGNTIAPPTV